MPSAFRAALLHLLDLDRHRAFRAFFLAVRSRRLSQAQAHGLWDRLLAADSLRERLRTVWSFPGARDAARAYQATLAPGEPGQGHTGGDEVSFGGMYISIVLGRVSLHQLKQQPLPRAWGVLAPAPRPARA